MGDREEYNDPLLFILTLTKGFIQFLTDVVLNIKPVSNLVLTACPILNISLSWLPGAPVLKRWIFLVHMPGEGLGLVNEVYQQVLIQEPLAMQKCLYMI